MKTWIKNALKEVFLIIKMRNRFSPSVQISQRKMYLYYKEILKKKALPEIRETGYRVFSQFEEDGKLLFIFSIVVFLHDWSFFFIVGQFSSFLVIFFIFGSSS